MSTAVADPKATPPTDTPPPNPQPKPGEREPDVPIGSTKDGVAKQIESGRFLADRILKQHQERKAKAEEQESPPNGSEKPGEGEEGRKPAGEKKPRKPKQDPPPAAITREDIAEVAGAAAAAAVRETRAAEKPPAPEPVKVEVPEEYAEDREIIEHLATAKPEYRDFVGKLSEFSKKEDAYIKEWEKANPGDDYDPSSELHDAFYANQPTISKQDRKWAERDMEDKRVEAKVNERLKPHLDEINARKTEESVMPKVVAGVSELLRAVVAGLDPELAKLEDANAIADALKKDPDRSAVGAAVARQFEPLVGAVVQLCSGVKYNPENQAHVGAETLAVAAEQDILKLKPEDQLDQAGRKFAPAEAYRKMSAAEQAKHWYLDQQNLLGVIYARAQAQTQDELERVEFENWKKGKANGNGSVRRASPPPPPPKRDTTPPSRSPSIGAAPAVDAGSGNGGGGNMRGRDRFWQRIGIPAP